MWNGGLILRGCWDWYPRLLRGKKIERDGHGVLLFHHFACKIVPLNTEMPYAETCRHDCLEHSVSIQVGEWSRLKGINCMEFFTWIKHSKWLKQSWFPIPTLIQAISAPPRAPIFFFGQRRSFHRLLGSKIVYPTIQSTENSLPLPSRNDPLKNHLPPPQKICCPPLKWLRTLLPWAGPTSVSCIARWNR